MREYSVKYRICGEWTDWLRIADDRISHEDWKRLKGVVVRHLSTYPINGA